MTGNTVTVIGVGSCTVVASQAGNASFQPAPDVARTFAIAAPPAPQPQTISFGVLPDHTLATRRSP